MANRIPSGSRLFQGFSVALVLWVGLTGTALAGGTVALQFENDILGLDDSDKHYTNGLALSWLSRPDQLPGWLDRRVRGHNAWFGADTFHLRLAVGQNLFTPEDIKTTDLVVDDRPYAGWLHGDMTIVAQDDNSLTLLEISLGVVGPSAMGREVQDWVHGVIDSPIPQGWDNQLHDEFAVMVGYGRKWRNFGQDQCWTVPGLPGLEFDISPQVDMALGNVFTYAATGVSLRLGQGLRGTVTPIRLRPGGTGSLIRGPGKGFAWNVFTGIEGRWMIHNIFLDGNTFGSSHSVERIPLVGDFWVGWDLSWRSLRMAVHYVNRSREFVGQHSSDHFGALTFAVDY